MKKLSENTNYQQLSHQKVAELLVENAQLKTQIEHQKQCLEQQAKLIADLELFKQQQQEQILKMQHQMDALLRVVYGKKSERFILTPLEVTQLSLFQDHVPQSAPQEEPQIVSYKRNKTKKKPPVRQELPAHLPRVTQIIEPDFDTSQMKRINVEVTEILEVDPAKLWVRRIERPIYAFNTVEEDGFITQGIVVAPMPERFIDRCLAGNSVLTLICVEKFVDHLPFHRQIQRYLRENVTLNASTFNGWFVKTCFRLILLYEALKKEVLQTDYLQADESHIKVQITQKKNTKNKKPPAGNTHKGQLWIYRNPVQNIAFFEYQTSRRKEHPLKTLKDFKGHLQTDDYGGYEYFDRHPDYIAVKCMAHARRKFDEALKENYPVASLFMVEIQKLYDLEEELRQKRPVDQSDEDYYQHRKSVRQEKALPILKKIKTLLDQYHEQVLPKRLTGSAIRYALNNWTHLCEYCEHGKIEIDNNLIENLIRPIAIGRKNYLFAGSHEAAQNAAMMYSFFGVCKHHNINPFNWLLDVLDRINEHPINRINELLPQHWKKNQPNYKK